MLEVASLLPGAGGLDILLCKKSVKHTDVQGAKLTLAARLSIAVIEGDAVVDTV
jgi:hypothetical protein